MFQEALDACIGILSTAIFYRFGRSPGNWVSTVAWYNNTFSPPWEPLGHRGNLPNCIHLNTIVLLVVMGNYVSSDWNLSNLDTR